MPRVLAIDPGNHCGFAVVDDSGLVLSDVWRLHKDGERKDIRFWRLFHRLSEVYGATGKPEAVAFETKLKTKKTTTANLLNTGGFIGVIRAWSVQVKVADVRFLYPSELKHRATGNGRASKADMCAWASHTSGKDIRDDNEADAVCLAFVIHEELTRA